MCKRCNVLRLAWYLSPPEKQEQAKAEYMAQLKNCDDHKKMMQWATNCPPNPELSQEELEAA